MFKYYLLTFLILGEYCILSQTQLVSDLSYIKKTVRSYTYIYNGDLRTTIEFNDEKDIGHYNQTTTSWKDWISVYKVILPAIPDG